MSSRGAPPQLFVLKPQVRWHPVRKHFSSPYHPVSNYFSQGPSRGTLSATIFLKGRKGPLGAPCPQLFFLRAGRALSRHPVRNYFLNGRKGPLVAPCPQVFFLKGLRRPSHAGPLQEQEKSVRDERSVLDIRARDERSVLDIRAPFHHLPLAGLLPSLFSFDGINFSDSSAAAQRAAQSRRGGGQIQMSTTSKYSWNKYKWWNVRVRKFWNLMSITFKRNHIYKDENLLGADKFNIHFTTTRCPNAFVCA